MDKKESLVASIIEKEWEMFQRVQNIGGRASCQEDLQTFQIMRSSQAASWSEAMLESYIEDLKDAERAERNLLTEKYARMMESTAPSEYARMEHLLPPVKPEVVELVEQIVEMLMEWGVELIEKFPHILGKSRPLFSTEDSLTVTSMETYHKGELMTYSVKTLRLYLENIHRQRAENINGSAVTMLATMKHYGFNSLEEANEKLNPRSA